MHKILLKFLDLFRWLFKMLGADYDQLRAIVETKVMMDNRRQSVGYRQKKEQESNNAFIITLAIYGIFGIFVSFSIYFIPSFILSMIVFFSYILIMIIMTLITDFSAILLDTSDNTIILPRPVDGRTLFLARLTHILLYLGQLATGLSIFPVIAVLFKYGVAMAIIFVVAIFLSILTAVVLTNAFYLLVMLFSSEEKLKSIINYAQIGMAVVFMGGYQILPRLMERMDIEQYVFEIQWWNFLLPPVWMAGTLEMIYTRSPDVGHVALLGCAVLFPLIGAYAVNRYLSPVFNRKLGAINNETSKVVVSKEHKKSLWDKLSVRLTNHPYEQAAFDIIQRIIGRDRKLKLKIYPAYGYILVFGMIFIMKGQDDLVATWNALPSTDYHLLLIYLTFMVIQIAIFEIPYSDEFKASWVYHSAPVEKPGEILSGTLKAIFVKLFMPGYIVVSVIILAIWRVDAVDDILFGVLNNFIMVLTLSTINKRYLPLSLAPSVRNQAGNIARSMTTFLCIGAIGLIHYLLSRWPIALLSAIPLQVVIAYFMLRSYKRTQWQRITL